MSPIPKVAGGDQRGLNRSQHNPPPGRFLPWFVAFEVTLIAGAIWMWWT